MHRSPISNSFEGAFTKEREDELKKFRHQEKEKEEYKKQMQSVYQGKPQQLTVIDS